MADVTTNIDFFGFTGENTVNDIVIFFLQGFDLSSLNDVVNQYNAALQSAFDGLMKCILINTSGWKKYKEIRDNSYKDPSKYTDQPTLTPYKLKITLSTKLKEICEHACDFTPQTFGYSPGSQHNAETEIKKFLTEYFSSGKIDESLYGICSNFARKMRIDGYNISDEEKDILRKHYSNKIKQYRLQSNFVGLSTIMDSLSEGIEAGRKQFVFTGAPGTGKTFGVKAFAKAYIESKGGDAEKQFKFVQFHSSYDYNDFVEGLKPAVIGHNADGEPVTSFVRMDGVFKKFCRKADNDKDKLYFFIIDEINRADLSRVFGELMYCLEESYRGEGNKVDTQYQNLPAYEYKDNSDTATPMANDIFAQGFYIPENVVIIGTMNDIDRSVETFDFALRRRFRWINITAEESLAILDERLKNKDTDLTELKRKINALNGEIKSEDRLGEDFQLGQSYFANMTNQDIDDSNNYFESELLPILKEYVRGRNTEKINEFIEACGKAFIGDTYVYPK